MKERTGASDSAKIEVLRGQGNTGNVSIGGVFEVEAFHPDGTCFHSSVNQNMVTLEWVKELTHIYASALDGTVEMDEGTTTIIGSLAGGSITYDPAGDATTKYSYMLEIGTNGSATALDDTYANSATKRAASTDFDVATRKSWGTAGIPLIFAGDAAGASATSKYTASNQSVDLATDERATWIASDDVTINSVSLVFTNDTVMADVNGFASGGALLNRLVARAVIVGGVILADNDTIKVRYSMTLLAS